MINQMIRINKSKKTVISNNEKIKANFFIIGNNICVTKDGK
jgi:hypothetical protein